MTQYTAWKSFLENKVPQKKKKKKKSLSVRNASIRNAILSQLTHIMTYTQTTTTFRNFTR